MKRFSCVLLLTLLLTSVYADTKISTRISGIISNRLSEKVELSFTDNFITFEEKRFPMRLGSDGFFEVTFYFEEAKEVSLKHGNRQYRLFVEPGDNILMKLDTRMVNAIPSFEGQGASNNNYFALYQQQFSKYSDAYIRSQMMKVNHQEFKSLADRIRKEKLAFFSANNSGITRKFDAHALADIDYWWAYQLLQYRWEHPPDPGQSIPIQLPDEYYVFLDELEIHWEDAMTNANYVYFISEFLNFDEERRAQTSLENFSSRPYRNARMYLSGEPLAYMMAYEMYLMLKRKKHQLYEAEIKLFIRDTPFRKYALVLKEAYESTQKIQHGQVAPDFEVVDRYGNRVRLSDFRGKVVYLDFWATWCPPCLKELPFSRQLSRSFSSNDVVFLYVSLDVNEFTWKEYLKKHQLNGHHFFTQGVYESPVAKSYYLKALPNFMLIDQQGVVVKNPAKRPSQEGVRSEIQSLLRKKW
ncbi:MAG: TlpA disulfide reductase family protein [Bacteroidota bacterium]